MTDDPRVAPDSERRTLSGRKRLLGLGAVFVVIILSGLFGFWLRPGPIPEVVAPNPIGSVMMVGAGLVVGSLGAAFYGLCALTRCFTFRFDRPFFRVYRWKGWVLKIVCDLLFTFGFALVCAPMLFTLLYGLLPGQVVSVVGLGVPFVLAQFVTAWLTLMGPIERRLILRRMTALGMGSDRFPDGLPMGISDPARNSFKKFPLIEEDMGLLWLTPTHVSYRGDATMWDAARGDVLEIERKADAGSTSSYFGAVHVVLRIRQADGSERRIRLHPEGSWTHSGQARALELLATTLKRWQATGATETE